MDEDLQGTPIVNSWLAPRRVHKPASVKLWGAKLRTYRRTPSTLFPFSPRRPDT